MNTTKKAIISLGFFSALLLPQPAFAAFEGFQDLIKGAGGVLQLLLALLIGVAVVVFFWGVITYIFHADDEKAVERGRRIMVGGIIGLFVMLAIWGIIGLIAYIFFKDPQNVGNSPSVPTINLING